MDNFNEKGALLKKAREAKGISLESVQEQTKIPLDALRAIEEGYTIRTLSPFYQKGFIKIYAQYLEYDVNEALGDSKPQEVSSSSPHQKKFSQDSPKPFSFQQKTVYRQTNYSKPSASGNSAQNLSDDEQIRQQRKKSIYSPDKPSDSVTENKLDAGARAVLSFNKRKLQIFFTPERVGLMFKIAGLAFAVFIFFKTVGFIGAKLNSKEKKVSSVKASAMRQAMKTKKENQLKDNRGVSLKQEDKRNQSAQGAQEVRVDSRIEVPLVSAPPVEVPPVQEILKNVKVSVRAKKNSWLHVKVDGVTVFEAVLKRGVSETWSAQSEIEILGKSLNHLEFEINGKMIGVLGRGESHAKTVVVTKNGLSIKK